MKMIKKMADFITCNYILSNGKKCGAERYDRLYVNYPTHSVNVCSEHFIAEKEKRKIFERKLKLEKLNKNI